MNQCFLLGKDAIIYCLEISSEGVSDDSNVIMHDLQ